MESNVRQGSARTNPPDTPRKARNFFFPGEPKPREQNSSEGDRPRGSKRVFACLENPSRAKRFRSPDSRPKAPNRRSVLENMRFPRPRRRPPRWKDRSKTVTIALGGARSTHRGY